MPGREESYPNLESLGRLEWKREGTEALHYDRTWRSSRMIPMEDQDMPDDVTAPCSDDVTEFIEWMRVQHERIKLGQPQGPVTEDPLDKTHFVLSDADFDQIKELLDNPPPPSEGLRRLMARKPRWE
jgi:hypothetical protein